MPLSDVEKKIINKVVEQYLNERKPANRRELVLEFEDPEAVDRLHQWMLLQTADSAIYLPTSIAFYYCGDTKIRELAKRSVQIVAHVLSKLFREENPSLALTDIEKRARDFYDDADEQTIRLGLYVAPDLGLINGFRGKNASELDVTPTLINERVVKLKDFDTLWDKYVSQWNGELGPPWDRNDKPTSRVAPLREPRKVVPKGRAKAAWVPKRWKIIRSLLEGGQSWTYLVERVIRGDKNKYVLKRLKNKERLVRFKKEIEVLTKLSHHGILRIVETSEASEEPFYVSEYCEKGDLTRLDLSHKAVLPRLQIFREICDAMAAAHKANVIHRDLKPQNILVRNDDSIVVGDFGLCLDLSDLEGRFTSSTEAVGPRNYIAPELEDGRLDNPKPSSDCYSLGKLLYYILSGRSFARERHGDSSYDLRISNGSLGIHFIYELLDHSISAEPSARYDDAAKFLEALDGIILKIERNAHVLDIRVPQHCLYCVSGRYQPMTDVSSIHELRFRCTQCGNIQIFASGGYPWWTGQKR